MNHELIAVDIGNTFVHLAVYPADETNRLPQLTEPSRRAESSGDDLETMLATLSTKPTSWFIASVHRGSLQRLRDWVSRQRPQDELRVLTRHDFALQIDVEAPDRVGVDRLAAAVAVNQLRAPHRPAIVIDSGTATTVDVLSAEGVFLGGVILAGARIAAAALARSTDSLPEATPPLAAPPVIGRSTMQALESGIYWGALGAVREIVVRIRDSLGVEPELHVTGGGAVWMEHLQGANYGLDLTLAGVAVTGRRLLLRGADNGC